METRNSSQEKLSEEELQSIANLEDLRDMLIDYRDEEKKKKSKLQIRMRLVQLSFHYSLEMETTY